MQRVQRHVARTAQPFEAERATRRGKFMLLTEDIDIVDRVDDRLEEKQCVQVFDEVEASGGASGGTYYMPAADKDDANDGL